MIAIIVEVAVAQSNYGSQANNVEYLGKGLPEEATLDGKVSTGAPHLKATHSSLAVIYSIRFAQQLNIEVNKSTLTSCHVIIMIWNFHLIVITVAIISTRDGVETT